MQRIDARKRKPCSEAHSDILSRHNAALPNARALALLLKPSEAADADFERRLHSEHEILLTKPQFSLTVDTLISALILLSFNLKQKGGAF